MPLKVLFIARASLFTNKGGDTIQVLNTSKFLQAIGVEVEIRLCNEKIDYAPYDLIHFFNIIRPSDILHHSRKAGKPYVISTIYVDYSEFDRHIRSGASGILFRLLPSDLIEYMKVLARGLVNGERIVSLEYLWTGHRRSVKKIIKGAALLLPNSNNEYKRLAAHYHISHAFLPIPNAIDPSLFDGMDHGIKRENDLVLCVGRIEGLKNQLNVIRALNGTQYRLFIIGTPATNQRSYYEQCRKEAGDNVNFIESLPQKELVNYYRKAKVHVLASWFETTGLSSLEAAAMGCAIVITDKGDTREYFGDMAAYCDPVSPASIYEAVNRAATSVHSDVLQRKILTNYTWQITAEKTLEAYRIALNNKKI